MPVNLVNIRGTELLESDTRERYRQKLARITLDSMVQFVGLLDATGTVLEINQVALDAARIELSDVEGKPFWTTFWWQVSEEINATLRQAIVRASQGEFVRWDTEIFGRSGGTETIIIDASLCPVRDDQGNVVFITAEGRDITEKKAQEREIARQREELAKLAVLKTEFVANISQESEDRFRAFANTAPAILWISELDGSCSFVSKGWCDYTGQSEHAALGFGWLDAVHPDDREEARRAFVEATSRREPFSMDYRLRRADGEYRWAMDSGRPRFDKDGQFAGFAGSVIDVHERKQAALSSALLSAIVESSDDAIVSKDLNGIIRSWNSGAERVFGYSASEVIGKPITIIIPQDRIEEEVEILSRLQRGERIEHFETRRLTKNGKLLSVSLTVSPVRDASGKVIGASKVARDVTEREFQEKALREANEALTRANGDLQQFAYSASHDLQEPIRSISVYGEMLSQRYSDRLDAKGLQYLSFMTAGAQHMEMLVKDLLAYTQTSETLSDPGAVDANIALGQALTNVAEAIRQAGAVVSHDALPTVRMHEVELQQLFQNIIGNAIKYRKEDETPRIHITARMEGGRWLFTIRDNGIGIAPAYKDTIFGIFKRLHTDSKYSGTGIGLAICQKIVERNGGRIWVESELGEGATFFFTVPRAER
jgi:PAS domain S-box-containing protein